MADKNGKPGYLVDGPEDLHREWFDGVKTVGVTAGASAPEILVQGVITQLRAWGGEVAEELQGPERTRDFRAAQDACARSHKRTGSLSSVSHHGLECAPFRGNAAIAQLVEQRIRNAWVRGSNPLCGTILFLIARTPFPSLRGIIRH